MNFDMKQICLIFIIFIYGNISFAEAKQLNFCISSTYPPFQHFTREGTPSGIFYDLLAAITTKYDYRISMTKLPRNRLEQQVIAGDKDVFSSSLEWIKNKNSLIHTDPIATISEKLITLSSNQLKITKIEDLIGMTVVTIRGYHFPNLDPYFKSNKIKRLDVKDGKTALNMLLLKRAKITVLGINSSKWLIRKNNWKGKFKFSKLTVTNASIRYVFNKKWIKLIPKLNLEIKRIKQSGELQDIINKYILEENK